MKAVGGVGKIHQVVEVVNLDFQQVEHDKAEGTGDFRAQVVADVGHVKSNQVVPLLLEMPKGQSDISRGIDLIDLAAQTLDNCAGIGIKLRGALGPRWGDEIVPGARIHQKKPGRGVIYKSRD